jgi:O-antigen ligase
MTRFLDRPAEAVATYGLAAYILCLPLEFTSVYLRQQLSRYVLVVVAAAFLVLLVTGRRRIVIPRTVSAGLLLLYIATSLVSWLITRAPGSISSLADLVLYPVVALLIMNLAVNAADHRRAWTAFLLSAVIVGVLGIVLFLAHLSVWTPNPLVANRLNITFGDPNITARFLTLGACAAILMYGSRQGSFWLCAAAATVCALVMPLTLSRSGLGLFPLTAALAVIVSIDWRRAAVIAVAALIVFGAVVAINPDARQRAQEAYATVASAVLGKSVAVGGSRTQPVHTTNVADDNRVYLIRAGLAMFEHRPLTGVGFGGYQHALTTTYRSYLPTNRNAANLDTLSHASLVTVMAEQGVIGTMLLLAFFVVLGVELWRARKRHGPLALWATIPGALIVPIFLYSNIEGRLIQEPYLWLAVGLLYSAMALRRTESARFVELPEAA